MPVHERTLWRDSGGCHWQVKSLATLLVQALLTSFSNQSDV